jgi:hypothetical protein
MPTDRDLPTFLKISATLTGYSEEDLEGTGMLETYYYTIMKEQDLKMVRGFFQKAAELLHTKPGLERRIEHVFIRPTQKNPPVFPYDGLARRIILLWYTGIWTTTNWKDNPDIQKTAMVNTEAYMQGLIWRTAGTHPTGARPPGYGSWAECPIESKS